MLKLKESNNEKELVNLSNSKILIITQSLKSQTALTSKCIDCGVKEENIYYHNSIFSINEILNSSFSHVIIEAGLYNYFVFNAMNNFITNNNLSVLIHHQEEELKTIRLITDNRLIHINDTTTSFLLGKLLKEHYVI